MKSVRITVSAIFFLSLVKVANLRGESDPDFELLPGVLVDRESPAVYLMSPDKGIDAVDPVSGALIWSGPEAARPLVIDGESLIAQTEPVVRRQPGDRRRRAGRRRGERGGRLQDRIHQGAAHKSALEGGVCLGAPPCSAFPGYIATDTRVVAGADEGVYESTDELDTVRRISMDVVNSRTLSTTPAGTPSTCAPRREPRRGRVFRTLKTRTS